MKYKLIRFVKRNGVKLPNTPDEIISDNIQDKDTAARMMAGMYILAINHIPNDYYLFSSEFTKDKAFITAVHGDDKDNVTIVFQAVEMEE